MKLYITGNYENKTVIKNIMTIFEKDGFYNIFDWDVFKNESDFDALENLRCQRSFLDSIEWCDAVICFYNRNLHPPVRAYMACKPIINCYLESNMLRKDCNFHDHDSHFLEVSNFRAFMNFLKVHSCLDCKGMHADCPHQCPFKNYDADGTIGCDGFRVTLLKEKTDNNLIEALYRHYQCSDKNLNILDKITRFIDNPFHKCQYASGFEHRVTNWDINYTIYYSEYRCSCRNREFEPLSERKIHKDWIKAGWRISDEILASHDRPLIKN